MYYFDTILFLMIQTLHNWMIMTLINSKEIPEGQHLQGNLSSSGVSQIYLFFRK